MKRTAGPAADAAALPGAATEDAVPEGFHHLLAGLKDTPALVISHRRDVLLWNPLARALFARRDGGARDSPTGPRPAPAVEVPAEPFNLARVLFLDPATRELYPRWDQEARLEAAALRRALDHHPDDPALAALVGELRAAAPDFDALWPHAVGSAHAFGTRWFEHPRAGSLQLAYEHINSPDEPCLSVLVFSAEPGTASERALRELACGAQDAPGADPLP